MNKFCILLADNVAETVKLHQEFLERAGYHILTASNPAEARHMLRQRRVHLAVLDMRLERDEDDKDKSGFYVARSEARSVPKIILTNWPNVRDAVESLKRDLGALPPAVEYLYKQETSLDDLLTAVTQAITDYVHINWQLHIRWHGNGGFWQLAALLAPDSLLTDLPERAAELEDLFRKLFYDESQITIGPLLTTAEQRVILPLYAFAADGTETQCIVSTGEVTAVTAENERYEKQVPQRFGIKNIGKLKTAETVHFGATAYTFMGADLEATVPFGRFVQNRTVAEVTAVLDYLYTENLKPWHDPLSYHAESDWLAFALAWLKLPPAADLAERLRQNVAAVAAQSSALIQIDHTTQTIRFRFEDVDMSLPHPALLWEAGGFGAKPFAVQGTVAWGVAHGRVTADTVLVDEQQRAWLVDFAQVARAPVLIDFVLLETAVKYDLFPTKTIAERVAWLPQLLSESVPDGDLPTAVQTIAAIRRHAFNLGGGDWRAYQELLYLCSLSRLLAFDPQSRHTPHVLAATIHALVEVCLLAQTLAIQSQPQPALVTVVDVPSGLWLDEVNKSAWVQRQPVELTPQEYDILAYLVAHAGQLCERRDIVEQALQEPFDEYDPEQSRLNSAMSRLRRKLEPDPQHPQYLMTVHGRGYRLFVQ